MTGLLILIGGVALFGYFWFLKNKEERNNQPTPNFMEMYAQAEKKHFEQIHTMPTRKMDKYIADVPNSVRDNQIEAIIYDAIICYSKTTLTHDENKRPIEIINKEEIPLAVIEKFSHIKNNEKPAHYLAAAYAFLYCNNDIQNAAKYGKLTLQELDCYHRDHIILNVYKWLYKEVRIAPYLFDKEGNSLIPGNPLLG